MKHLHGMNKLTRLASVEAMVCAAPPGSSRSTTTSSIFNICLFRIICIPIVSFTWGSQAVYKQFNLSSLILCWKACSSLRSPQLPACNPPLHRLSNQVIILSHGRCSLHTILEFLYCFPPNLPWKTPLPRCQQHWKEQAIWQIDGLME